MVGLVILIFVIALLLAVIKIDTKFQNLAFVILGCILILMAGFRGAGVDNDYNLYNDAYQNLKYYDIDIEVTFKWLASFVRFHLNDNITYLFIIYAILGVSTKMFAIKQLTNLWFLSLLIYISNIYLLQEITQIRAGVASGLLLLSIKPLYEKDAKLFFLLTIIATLFHSSALIMVTFWFFDTKSINKTVYSCLIPASYLLNLVGIHLTTLIAFIPIPLIQVKFEAYNLLLSKGETVSINIYSVFAITRIIICFFLIWKNELISKSNKYLNILLKIYVVSCCLFVLVSDLPTIAFRLSELLQVVEVILIPLLIYGFKGKKWIKSMMPVSLGVFLLWLIVFYSKLIK